MSCTSGTRWISFLALLAVVAGCRSAANDDAGWMWNGGSSSSSQPASIPQPEDPVVPTPEPTTTQTQTDTEPNPFANLLPETHATQQNDVADQKYAPEPSADRIWDEVESTPDTAVLIVSRAGGKFEFDDLDRPIGLDLQEAKLTEQVFKAAGQLRRVRWIDLRKSSLKDQWLRHLGNLPELELLALNDTAVTDNGLAGLSHLPTLRFLALDRTSVTDKGLMSLAGISTLEGVSLIGTEVTLAGAEQFKQHVSGCDLVIESKVSTPAPAGEEANPFAPQPESTPPMPPHDDRPQDEQIAPSNTGAWETSTQAEPFGSSVEEPQAQPFERPTAPEWETEEAQEAFDQLPELDHQPEQISPKTPGIEDPFFSSPQPQVHPASDWPHSINSPAPRQTRQELSNVLRRKLEDPEVLRALGEHLMSQGRYPEAAQAFAGTVHLQPEEEEPRFQLAVALARSGRFDEALPHFRRVVGEAAAHYNVGIIAYEAGEGSLAERHFAAAVAADPRLANSPEWQERHRRSGTFSKPSGSEAIEQGDVLKLLSTALGASTPAATSTPQRSLGIEIVPNRATRSERLAQEPIDEGIPMR